ncbi:MAG: S8 family serine peptidase [Candidatus Zixiibacteriota bacterium]
MTGRFIKKTVIAAGTWIVLACSASGGELTPGLAKAFASVSAYSTADTLVEVVVFLDDYEPKEAVYKVSQAAGLSRSERAWQVIDRLKSYRSPYKEQVLDYVMDQEGAVVKEHWIVPAITVSVPVSRLAGLADIDGIKLVVENVDLVFESPVKTTLDVSTLTTSVSTQLEILGVPELWKRGLRGKGALVCSFDTGVEQSHPALASKWRGNRSSLESAWYSTVAPDTLPYDLVGHGTHTMGIMVGSTEADTFGVAPSAEWITAAVVDQGRTLSMTISDILGAFQWSLNPDGDFSTTDDIPDVILNSWGIPRGLFIPCDDTFWGAIDNVEAAGIVTIFAAGNEGPEPRTLRNPADRASTPVNSFAVGAVDNAKMITSFSSRGPSSCDTTQVKPEVVAPGVDIRSSYKGGGYALMTGTSMAAPYLAGMVALVREYNPEATVEQIKYAFLSAAEDLGVVGQDNAYGHGFVNASRILDYIPLPSTDELEIASLVISGDGLAFPGETFELQLTLTNSAGNIDGLAGTIGTESVSGVTLDVESSYFYFGTGGTIAISAPPFVMTFDSSLYHGQQVDFSLLISTDGQEIFDTIPFQITVGLSPKGVIASHQNNKMKISVSDFGQFGFAPGSAYNALGDGFCYDGSDNLLYEAGLVIGSSDSQMANSVRNEAGLFEPSDFTPIVSLSEAWIGEDGGTHRRAVFTDGHSTVPVNITQETISFDNLDDQELLILKYTLTNKSLERLTNLHFGFMMDFDLSESDEIGVDESINMIYQKSEDDLYVALLALENVLGFQALMNGETKTGFDATQLYDLISATTSMSSASAGGDMMFASSSGPFIIDQQKSINVVVALVSGHSMIQLYENVRRAQSIYELSSSLAGDDSSLPRSMKLYQNYPNPFNPTTRIAFSLSEAGETSLEIFNVIGQKVRSLHSGHLTAGLHQFEWDGTDEYGHRVASGVYFYRLESHSATDTRKMVLIK